MHQHRSIEPREKTIPYIGHSVRPDKPNPVAHGNVTHIEVCACGARRLTNSNGGRLERGPWTKK